jgi:hypothetical protein
MKTSIVIVALLASGLAAMGAGQYQVVGRGANYNVLQKTTVENGTNRVHQIVELATGLNYTNSYGQWVASREEIETFPRGAIARQGRYQVIFANNLNSAGAIDQQMPDGKRLRSNILGLAYDDRSTGQSVLIAQVQDSQGELIASNQVLYSDAFEGVKADVRYSYRNGSFEQDVILREQPPAPDTYGLNPATTELEVLTEFINPPQETIKGYKDRKSGLVDQEVSWGVTHIGRGKAFDLGANGNVRQQVSVRRQYETVNGRKILVEIVPVKSIQSDLQTLPLQASIKSKLPTLASKTLELPPTPLAQAGVKPMRLASTRPADGGFVLDYVEMNSDQLDDFTFQNGTTYWIDGWFNTDCHLYFEGGTVLKYTDDAGIYCYNDNNTGIYFESTPDHPAIFTSESDDSVGEILPSSSGTPSMGGSGYLLVPGAFDPSAFNVHDAIFSYAGLAIAFWGTDPGILNNVQFIDCYEVCMGNNIVFNNGLASQCYYLADAWSLTGNNVTFDTMDYGIIYGGNAYLTNCVFANVTNIIWEDGPVDGSADYSLEGSYNGFFNATTFGDAQTSAVNYPFQTAANAHDYLAVGSPFRDAGTTNIDPNLLAELQTLTTYAPQDGGWLDTNTPDLGYHYDLAASVPPPIITQQLANQVAFVGQTTVFDVSVSGYGPLYYQWLFNGTPLIVSNIITTVAGNYSQGPGYSGDGQAATNATLSNPNAVALDGSGNLYIADENNSVIRKVDASGNIWTVAGTYNSNGYGGYSGDGGAATNAALSWPTAVVVDGSGNLYIADANNNVIRKVDASGIITTVAGNGNVDYTGDSGPATNATLNWPGSIAVDCSGNLYIADSYNSVIRKVDASGIITTVAGNGSWGYTGDRGSATNATLNWPDGLALDGQGNLYIADAGNGVIRMVDANSNIWTVAGNGSWGYSGDGGAATNATLNWLGGLAMDSSGNLYIADANNNVIRKVDASGVITTLAGNYSLGESYSGDGGEATNAALSYPYGVTVDGLGHLYIADSGNNVIRDVTSNYSIDSEGNLTIYNAQTGQNGTYQLIVSNAYGGSITSSPMALTVDPNIIQFSIEVTNNYVNTSTAIVQANITAGVPSYYAIFVNSTTTTNWLPFTTTNIVVSLGSTDGVYTVNVGLRGLPANAPQTWQSATLTKDTAPPVLVVTNPVSGTVDQPLIQLEGYSTKALSALTFDVSNSLGVVTGQQGFVTDQYYDTNLWMLTTNYFQCFDIELTNGLNLITLQATDLAGNVTTSNFCFTLDYSGATNPVVQLTWPQDGMQICQDNFTLRGWVDDPTAIVSASITDASGNTSIIAGQVERTGIFWVDSLPLAEGTNWVTLNVTNSAGLPSETNISVVKSDMTLTLTSIDGNLWEPTVNVSGNISDQAAAVWVNGIQGVNNGDGTWSAGNVPVSAGGVASFDMSAVNGGDPAANNNMDKPDRLYVDSDVQKMDFTDHYRFSAWWTEDTNYPPANWYEDWTTNHYAQQWMDGRGGSGTSTNLHIHLDFTPANVYNTLCTEQMNWPATNWENINQVMGTGTFTGDCSPNDDGTWPIWPPELDYRGSYSYFYGESCNVSDPVSPQTSFNVNHAQYQPNWEYTEDDQTYTRHAQTRLKLQPGGRALPHKMSLFQISGEASEELEKRASPPFTFNQVPQGIPSQNIQIGKLGNLGSDGNLWVALPDGGTSVDATPYVGKPFYIFDATEQKYKLVHQTIHPALTHTNCWDRENLGVGEEVNIGFQPDLAEPQQWVCFDGSVDTNAGWNGHGVKFTAPSNEVGTVVCVWVHGQMLWANFTVWEPKGVDHAIIVSTNETGFTFGTGVAGAMMHLTVFMKPTYVSFYRVMMEEVGEDATNITGYFTDANLFGTDPAVTLSHKKSEGGTADDPFQLGEDNSWDHQFDYCVTGDLPVNSFGNWSPGGSYTWNIPWNWWVEGSGNTNLMTNGWQQVFTIDSSGTVKITKFNNYWVQRTTNNIITNSLPH